ncbi:hypothetical protein ASZ90_011205 [hydrocarbon metagenome]|uniref:Uncharacterized protein n=1 Tax=hydrocarbon metagenome TaxID=938273 RepID=A0A0W8FDY0_9ZZZZ
MVIRPGSKTRSPPISWNLWIASGPVMSWIIARSIGAITTSPAEISFPHLDENIFSTIVFRMRYRVCM